MLKTLRLHLLVENSVKQSGLMAEHGLSFWVEADDKKFLWDTGQGQVLQPNAKRMKIDLSTADAIALSHGHYDHTSGLNHISPRNPPFPLYAHPGAFVPRFNDKNGCCSRTSDPVTENGIEALPNHFEYHPSTTRTELMPGLWLTGEIPRTNTIEDVGGRFCLDEALTQLDPIIDDQALVALTKHGWIVILGCAHAGVINTLEAIHAWDPKVPFHAMLGGMHLLNASEERMSWTLEKLRPYGFQLLAPMHCTGDHAQRCLHQAFPQACRDAHVGNTFSFN